MNIQSLRSLVLATLVSASIQTALSASARLPDDPRETGRVLSDVARILGEKYVRDLGSDKLLENGLRGLMQGVDPHTVYLNPQEWAEFHRNVDGKFGGVGFVLGVDPQTKRSFVKSRFYGAPAIKGGVQKGDQILAIDGKSTDGMEIDRVIPQIMGKVGTTVTLTLGRTGQERPEEITLRRQVIETPSVRGFAYEPGGLWNYWLDPTNKTGYVRIMRFSQDTFNRFRNAVASLRREGLRALVIDLRDCPGGLLKEAVSCVDLFVDSGLIVRSVGRNGKERRWEAKRGEITHLPLAVLVNDYTASSAEIMAAARQDHGRAIVAGIRSYGKGSIQVLYPVGKSGGGLKITVATYFPPSGRNIDKLSKPEGSDVWGISPNPGLEVKVEGPQHAAWLKHFRELDGLAATDAEPTSGTRPPDQVLDAALEALRKTTLK